jgi:hypothetical protein
VTTNGACIMPPPGACGPTEPTQGTTCMGSVGSDTVCVYGATMCLCGCAGGFCGMPFTWSCSAPPTNSGCPAVVPNDGTACAAEGVECAYGDPCTATGSIVDCTKGVWKWNTMIACGG